MAGRRPTSGSIAAVVAEARGPAGLPPTDLALVVVGTLYLAAVAKRAGRDRAVVTLALPAA